MATKVVAEEHGIFKTDVYRWRQLNSLIQTKSEELKDLRKEKTEIDKRIMTYMEKYKVADKPIRIGQEEEITIVEKREYGTLSFGYIEESLDKILTNRDHVDFIIGYLRDNREVRETKCLKHSYRRPSGVVSVQQPNIPSSS